METLFMVAIAGALAGLIFTFGNRIGKKEYDFSDKTDGELAELIMSSDENISQSATNEVNKRIARDPEKYKI